MDHDDIRNRSPIGQFEDLLAEAVPDFEPIKKSARVLESTGFYDFSYFEFLFPTETGYRGSLSELALATLDDFQTETGADLALLMLDVLVQIEEVVRQQVGRLRRRDWAEDQVTHDLLADFYRLRASTLPDVLDAYPTQVDAGLGPLFLDFLAELSTSYVTARLYSHYPSFYGFWSAWPAFFSQHYEKWEEAVRPPPQPPAEGPADTDGQDQQTGPGRFVGDHPKTPDQSWN